MGESAQKVSVRDRVKWWLHEKCFAFCIRSVYPDADPSEFCFLDMVNFVAISKDELRDVIEEAPDLAWRFEERLSE